MSYPSTAATFYTHPTFTRPTSSSSGLLTNNSNTADYVYQLNSGDKFQSVAVYSDDHYGNQIGTYGGPGTKITFNRTKGTYNYSIASYDQNTNGYNSNFGYTFSFTISAGSMTYVGKDSNTTANGFVVQVTVLNIGALNAYVYNQGTTTVPDGSSKSIGSFDTYSASSKTVDIAFSGLKALTSYDFKITATLGDGSTAEKTDSQTTISDVVINTISATSTSTTITVSGTATKATSVKDSNGNGYSLDNNGAFTRDYTVASNTKQEYTVTATGTGGSATKTVSYYTLPTVSISTSATSYQVASGSSTVTVTLNVSGAFDKVQVYDSNFSTLLGTGTTANNYSIDVTKGKDGSPYTFYAVPYDNTLSSPGYNNGLAASTSFSVTDAGTVAPTGGPTPSSFTYGGETWYVMYITSNTTLTFTGSFNYQFMCIGKGGTGGNYSSDTTEAGGGGGAGSMAYGTFTSTANDIITYSFGSYKSMTLNGSGSYNYAVISPYVGLDGLTPIRTDQNQDGLIQAGNQGDGGSAALSLVFSSGNHFITSGQDPTILPPSFSSVTGLYGHTGANGIWNDSNNGGGGGGGGGATENGSNTRTPGTPLDRDGAALGNEGGAGGLGYTWIDNIEYGRGGPGGSIRGRDAVRNALYTAGSGGTGGGMYSPSGSPGQGALFAIAWKKDSKPVTPPVIPVPPPGSINLYANYDGYAMKYRIYTDKKASKFEIMRGNTLVITITITTNYEVDSYGNFVYPSVSGAFESNGYIKVYSTDTIIAYNDNGNASGPFNFRNLNFYY
jgi:hypothetical protein